ncbi:hypothetical protein DPMN_044932 [Dreissena polymorpha]|uniref:Uncharacterized protein n=1 Tax=Dreissena polymorpha TaxID=45954 RepID=A0A9D4D513_DREPO|nr:hypothetical protein DPMN_044932 [Dreissena polymorpha]
MPCRSSMYPLMSADVPASLLIRLSSLPWRRRSSLTLGTTLSRHTFSSRASG